MQQSIEIDSVGLFLLGILLLIVLLNGYATHTVFKSENIKRKQKWAQTSLIWLFPFVGSLITLSVHRKDQRKAQSSGIENPTSDNFGGWYD